MLLLGFIVVFGWSYYKGKTHEQAQIQRNTNIEIIRRHQAADQSRIKLEDKESEIKRTLQNRSINDFLDECLLSNDPFTTKCI